MTAGPAGGAPWFHLLPGDSPAVFVVPGSMLFDIDEREFAALARSEPEALAALRAYAPGRPPAPSALPPVTALSLNVAQACNMSCSYCYADEGRFGAAPRLMGEDVAFRAIDRLVASAEGRRATLGFIGGEPFLNRGLVHACVKRAAAAGSRTGTEVRFAVTTNATLLRDDDLALLREHAFAVTVSIDGGRSQNGHRPMRGGGPSVPGVVAGVARLLADPGRARVAARATITRDDLGIHGRLEALAALGFQEVGLSPARTGPRADLILAEGDWPILLANMVEASERELARVVAGAAPRFSNLWVALRAIHRGAARPLPCGSASTYLSVDADGTFHSCHRTVGKAGFGMGSLDAGQDERARASFLKGADVDRQEPCSLCWARYLCGGGCHAEVTAVGRTGCDFIRGWLEHCLGAYRRVADRQPELLGRGDA